MWKMTWWEDDTNINVSENLAPTNVTISYICYYQFVKKLVYYIRVHNTLINWISLKLENLCVVTDWLATTDQTQTTYIYKMK